MLAALPRRDLRPFWGLWISYRNSGVLESRGFWTGDDAQTFTVGGQSRSYYGAGAALSIEPISYQIGTVVQTQTASLGPLAAEVRQVLRGYDTKRAPVELHLFAFEGDTLIATQEAFVGFVSHFDISEGPIDDAGNSTVVCQMEMVSSARNLTKPLHTRMSDQSQRLRDSNDAFRKYSDIGGSVKVVWMGETDNPHRAREKR